MTIGSLFSGVGGNQGAGLKSPASGVVSWHRKSTMGGKGSGAKPKQYDPVLVVKVTEMYNAGHTQDEVAVACGVSQKVVWKLMIRHGIEARVAAKRDQRGDKNHAWKGDDAGYAAAHLRVSAVRGQPSLCEKCGTADSPRFEWASLTKNYTDVDDYIRLCCSCHHTMDGHVMNIKHMRDRMTGGTP